jgi:hypothetical protein
MQCSKLPVSKLRTSPLLVTKMPCSPLARDLTAWLAAAVAKARRTITARHRR